MVKNSARLYFQQLCWSLQEQAWNVFLAASVVTAQGHWIQGHIAVKCEMEMTWEPIGRIG
jgi:exosome complex RNA-binding protein Rrp42 (RNase PH superfamily)